LLFRRLSSLFRRLSSLFRRLSSLLRWLSSLFRRLSSLLRRLLLVFARLSFSLHSFLPTLMPITNNASYVPTLNEFLSHWEQVDATLPAPLLIANSKGDEMQRSDLDGLLASLHSANAAVIDKLNDEQIARGSIELQKPALLARLNEFNDMVAAYWGQTGFPNARPKAPNVSDGEERFLSPMVDAANLWGKMNAASPPPGLELPMTLAGMTLGAFQTAVDALRALYAAERDAQQDARLARAQRDAVKAAAYDGMKCYRMAVEARCQGLPELLASLPRLTPVSGGRVPEPVNASAVFVPPDQARVVYEASADPDLARYRLRGNPGTEYREGDAVDIATHLPLDELEFTTNFGLTQPGAAVTFRLFTQLTNGNEAGSAPMTVMWPA